jgi:hypothetical protein
MRREVKSALWILVGATTFWAYTIADSLIREFSANLTYIDLGALFILGLIAGVALSQVFPLRRWSPSP